MGEAFFWGALAASSLLVGAVAALRLRIGLRTFGIVVGLGAGLLIGAVAYDLVLDAFEPEDGRTGALIGLFAGAITFFAGDLLIDRMGGRHRKAMDRPDDEDDGTALAIVLGTVLDGIPESMVIGMSLIEGGTVGIAVVVAAFASNIPEALAATKGLVSSGWSAGRLLLLWAGVTAVSGLAALVGFQLLDDVGAGAVSFVLAFAGGALLTMVADTMMPSAYKHAGPLAGIVVTAGFAIAYGLAQA